MRTRHLALAISVVVGLGPGLVALAPPAVAAPATVKVIVMPVTVSGTAASGFSVKKQDPGFPVDCRYKDPSIAAVSPDIETCSPSAAYAPACWKAAAPGKVLCMRDASSHKVFLIKREGRFADTAIAKPRDRAPLDFVLTDGTKCQIRIGGAWGPVPHHPNLYGAYSCDRHDAAWLYAKGSHSDAHAGIDESGASWRIRTGYKHIVWRHIATAYFVATAP
ncbi:MAG TPA: hypothetical protein VHD81_00500 [Mycobacteriales bacterium]|nr:hypothetical protein [Mycobacteriales bacterium]